MNVIGVIPARYRSSRFPGKPLADIMGKPMIYHVYRACSQASLLTKILVATEDERIANVCDEHDIPWVMTSDQHPTGTDRVAEVAQMEEADLYVNIQGDEPMIDPDLIDELGRLALLSSADMVTPVVKITDPEVLISSTTVKVVVREDGTALYFSRSPIPFIRDAVPESWTEKNDFWLQVGTYACRRDVLLEYREWTESALEKMERIEQLRFLEAGKTIQTFETQSHSMAVDTPEDLKKVRGILAP